MPSLDAKTLDLSLTIAVLAACAGLFWYGRSVTARPADPANPRMLPWNAILIVLAFLAILTVVHLLNLLGIETGARRP